MKYKPWVEGNNSCWKGAVPSGPEVDEHEIGQYNSMIKDTWKDHLKYMDNNNILFPEEL